MDIKDLVFKTERGTMATDSMRVATLTGRAHKNIRKSVKRLIGNGYDACFYEVKKGNVMLFVMNKQGFSLVTKTLPGIEEWRKAAMRLFDGEEVQNVPILRPTIAVPTDNPEIAFQIQEQNGNNFVSARQLHAFLQVGKEFAAWMKYRIEQYDLQDGVDFVMLSFSPNLAITVGRPQTEYALTLDCAKELCMVENNERGKMARRYFIEIEKKFRQMVKPTAPAVPQSFAEALRLAASQAEQIEWQQKQIEAERPKVNFATAVETSNCSCLIGELAKMMCQNGVPTGEKRLFQWMRDNGYLCQFGERYNQPTQKAIEMGLFEVKKQTWTKPSGEVMTSTTTKVTGKGQIYFINKFLYKSQNNQQIYINE